MNFESGKNREQGEIPQADAEQEIGQEAERGFDTDFYVTDHSADTAETGSPEKLRELYADVKRDDVDSVRYDWNWRSVEPKEGEWSEE